MGAEKAHNLPFASWRLRKAGNMTQSNEGAAHATIVLESEAPRTRRLHVQGWEKMDVPGQDRNFLFLHLLLHIISKGFDAAHPHR